MAASDTLPAWSSKRHVSWGDTVISVVSPKGLILPKSLRGSGLDMDDIAYLGSINDED
jgi:hypothetical protein